MDSRLFWLALAAFVGGTEGGLIAGLLPAISAEMGVSIGQAGQLVIGYSLAYAIGTPLVAVLLGGVGRRRILAGAELGLAVCAALIAIAPSLEWMIGARTLLAVAAGTFTGTAMATAAMIAPPGKRGRALQIITMGQSLAVLLGVPLSTYVAARLSWRIDYAAIALMAGAAALALYVKLPRGMPGDTQTIRERIRVLANPGMRPALVSTMLFMAGSTSVMIYVAAVMTGAGLGLEILPLVLLANGIGAVASSTSAGNLTDRLGSRLGVIVFSLAVIAVLALYAALPHLPLALRLPVLLGIMVTQGYVGWAYWIANCSHIAHLAPTSVPVAISVNMAALNVGMALSAAAGGFIVDNWGANALAYAGAPMVIVALLIWLAVPVAEPAAVGRVDEKTG
jgi:predicted MFS family arabinose efflux permease